MPPTRTVKRPLDLKPGFDVPDRVLDALRYIERFDLRSSKDQAEATLEFKRFLALPVLYPGPNRFDFVPSLRLDALWHTFILDTPRYRDFCDRVYGQYLDHVPGKSRLDTAKAIRRGPMQFTVASIVQAFDNVHKRFWTNIAFCGPCLIFKPKERAARAALLRSLRRKASLSRKS